MSEVTSTNSHPDGVLNGTLGKQKPGVVETVEEVNEDGVEGGEESDDYDEEDEADYEEDRQIVGDEDDEDNDDEEEENGGNKNLTHLLLGNPNEPVDGDDLGDEEDEEDEDEDEDEEYVEGEDTVPVSSKKRSRDDLAEEDDAQEAKKVKA